MQKSTITHLFLLFLAVCSLTGCASKKYTNVNYLPADFKVEGVKPTLNVFKPRNSNKNKDVLIFVHGGNWNSGKKELYSFLGRNFAKRDVVTVIAGYTLSPLANYDDMAQEIAEVIKWTHNNIDKYGGNPERIFITGHSAGGHLAALATMNPKYLNENNLITGIILDDAAGLDMYNRLQEKAPVNKNNYITTWTEDKANWKDASPIYFLNEKTPPILTYSGLKSYEHLIRFNKEFYKELLQFQPQAKFIELNKKHVPMITQFIWPWSKRYKEIINFMKSVD
ncbi:MAG: alpha/beta hydrolase [Leeuwenhoekiella sp.]